VTVSQYWVTVNVPTEKTSVVPDKLYVALLWLLRAVTVAFKHPSSNMRGMEWGTPIYMPLGE